MGHIQQLAFALGPVEDRPVAPPRPRPAGRPGRPAAVAQPLLPEVAPAATVEPAAAIAPRPSPPPSPPPPAAIPPATPVETSLSDDGAPSPVKAALYVAIGFARGRERRRGGWHRLAEQGFASRRLAEEHAARLLARGRADGVLLTRQDIAADLDAADEPVILARLGELPAELLES